MNAEGVSSSTYISRCITIVCLLVGIILGTSSFASTDWSGKWERLYPVLTPQTTGGALSIRSPDRTITRKTDFEISSETKWPIGILEIVWERQNGFYQWGYSFQAERQNEDSLWRVQFLSIKKTSADIERQILSCDREFFHRLWMGLGIAAEEFSDPAGVITAEIPLPGKGKLAMASNFGRTTIYDINTRIEFKHGKIMPFIKWAYYADSPAKFWQIKAGLTYIIKE